MRILKHSSIRGVAPSDVITQASQFGKSREAAEGFITWPHLNVAE